MIAPSTVYAVCVTYLIENGWRREEPGSGWWWKDEAESEETLGGALEAQLDVDGIDQRNAIEGEPAEFWG